MSFLSRIYKFSKILNLNLTFVFYNSKNGILLVITNSKLLLNNYLIVKIHKQK